MKDEKHEPAPQADVDGALFEYLNEMLQDPTAGKFTSVTNPRFRLANKVATGSKSNPDSLSKADARTKADGSEVNTAKTNIRLIKPDVSRQGASGSTSEGKQARSSTTTAEHAVQDKQRTAWLSPSLLSSSEQVFASNLETSLQHPSAGVIEAKATPQTPADTVQDQGGNVSADQWNEPIPEAKPWCENGRPEWAQQEFECLIFSVNGLKLAVPLITLGSIQPLDKKLTHLPGQPDWFMGILPATTMGNLKVLDTALCVMPERYHPQSRDSLHYVITIHDCAWGLACDSVDKSITLHPDQVKWRTQRGKRPWLAGTVVEYMCSLVDTDGFHEFLI